MTRVIMIFHALHGIYSMHCMEYVPHCWAQGWAQERSARAGAWLGAPQRAMLYELYKEKDLLYNIVTWLQTVQPVQPVQHCTNCRRL